MARAARLSGAEPDDEEYQEFEEMLEHAETAQVRSVGFALSGKEDPHRGSKNCTKVALLPVKIWASLVHQIAV